MADGFESETTTIVEPYERPVDKVIQALCKAQAKFSTVAKTKTNPHFKSSYAPLEEVVKMAGPILAARA